MFSSNRKNQPPSVGAAATSLIARGVTVRGDVQFSGTLHLDGVVEGSVHADPGGDGVLTISETGRVMGRIEVPHAVINGGVTGDIDVSERLELAPLARIDDAPLVSMSMSTSTPAWRCTRTLLRKVPWKLP